MVANDTQIGGDHYKGTAIQPWDFIVQNRLGFLDGCIVKYITRARKKNGKQDYEKALHYLDKMIEVGRTALSFCPVSMGDRRTNGVFIDYCDSNGLTSGEVAVLSRLFWATLPRHLLEARPFIEALIAQS
jgi:hypothetical protein